MSYFIAQNIRYDEKENRIYVYGGDNNVRPRSNSWTHYDDNRYLLMDLISGGLDLKNRNSLAKKALSAIEEIKRRHKKQFGERQMNLNDGYWSSVNVYSLFQISHYPEWDKNKSVENTIKEYTGSDEKMKIIVQNDAEALESVWDEAVAFYKEAERYFYEQINIPIHNKETEETKKQPQLELF